MQPRTKAEVFELPRAELDPNGLMRLPQVLKLIPVSPATIWKWVREDRFPKPVKLPANSNTAFWRVRDVLAVIENA
jgi:predicted DNA-binding transcriptional regulator AlpA